jgi:hypothetical protein
MKKIFMGTALAVASSVAIAAGARPELVRACLAQ